MEELLPEFASAEVLLLGDFNIRDLGFNYHLATKTKEQEVMNTLISNYNLFSANQITLAQDPRVHLSTTFKNLSSIDYIFLSMPLASQLVKLEVPTRTESDHNPLTAIMNLQVPVAAKVTEVGTQCKLNSIL